jgi:hypothetical protein
VIPSGTGFDSATALVDLIPNTASIMIRALCILLLFTTSLLAIDRPKGFLTINWGASPEEAKRVMQGRPGVKFPVDADDYKFELTGGTFADQPVEKWILEFPDRKFASATVILKTDGDASLKYKEFRAKLVEKYGGATTDKKMRGDKKPGGERAPASGTQTIWKFVPNLKDKGNVSITCELAGGGQNGPILAIRYVNDTLIAAAAIAAADANAKPAATGVKKDEL